MPLGSIASVEQVDVPVSITASNGQRTARVSVTPSGANLGAVSTEVQARLKTVELPPGVTAEIGGATTQQAESFRQLGLALLAAIAIVYVIMVAAFKSLVQPLILLVSVPFAATGAIGLLLVTGVPLGLPSLIGMLMLVGIVVTNAIVLIDLINQYRQPRNGEPGMNVADAITHGARQRLRPILMTALATVFALTPMALGLTGGGGFISQPLAIVVIGGLISSTALTLVLVPVLYRLVEGRRERQGATEALRRGRRSGPAVTEDFPDDFPEDAAPADRVALGPDRGPSLVPRCPVRPVGCLGCGAGSVGAVSCPSALPRPSRRRRCAVPGPAGHQGREVAGLRGPSLRAPGCRNTLTSPGRPRPSSRGRRHRVPIHPASSPRS